MTSCQRTLCQNSAHISRPGPGRACARKYIVRTAKRDVARLHSRSRYPNAPHAAANGSSSDTSGAGDSPLTATSVEPEVVDVAVPPAVAPESDEASADSTTATPVVDSVVDSEPKLEVIAESEASGTGPSEAVVFESASGDSDSESTATSPSSEPSTSTAELDDLKFRLLAALSSLDRGIAANVRESREVDELASQLEAAGGKVSLDWKALPSTPAASTMDWLVGTWRLVYSSGFNSGGLGGTRPGPPAAFVPLVLGQVYQRIDDSNARLDNIVEFLFSYNLPRLPFSPAEPESPAVRLTLIHDFSVLGTNTVEISYEDTSAQFLGSQLLDSFPKLQLPQLPDFLRPPKFLRSATFDVTYLDETVRVTRGDRGELRIYLKDEGLSREAPADYED